MVGEVCRWAMNAFLKTECCVDMQTTVHEALMFSARLRLTDVTDKDTLEAFVNEVHLTQLTAYVALSISPHKSCASCTAHQQGPMYA